MAWRVEAWACSVPAASFTSSEFRRRGTDGGLCGSATCGDSPGPTGSQTRLSKARIGSSRPPRRYRPFAPTTGGHDLPAFHAARAIQDEGDIPRPRSGHGCCFPWQAARSSAQSCRRGHCHRRRGGATVPADRGSHPRRNRTMKSPARCAPARRRCPRIRQTPGPSSTRTACRLGANPQPSRVACTAPAPADCAGFGKPGRRTGGEIREASGTAYVSSAVPSPTDGPRSAQCRGCTDGATTSGKRNVTSPSL